MKLVLAFLMVLSSIPVQADTLTEQLHGVTAAVAKGEIGILAESVPELLNELHCRGYGAVPSVADHLAAEAFKRKDLSERQYLLAHAARLDPLHLKLHLLAGEHTIASGFTTLGAYAATHFGSLHLTAELLKYFFYTLVGACLLLSVLAVASPSLRIPSYSFIVGLLVSALLVWLGAYVQALILLAGCLLIVLPTSRKLLWFISVLACCGTLLLPLSDSLSELLHSDEASLIRALDDAAPYPEPLFARSQPWQLFISLQRTSNFSFAAAQAQYAAAKNAFGGFESRYLDGYLVDDPLVRWEKIQSLVYADGEVISDSTPLLYNASLLAHDAKEPEKSVALLEVLRRSDPISYASHVVREAECLQPMLVPPSAGLFIDGLTKKSQWDITSVGPWLLLSFVLIFFAVVSPSVRYAAVPQLWKLICIGTPSYASALLGAFLIVNIGMLLFTQSIVFESIPALRLLLITALTVLSIINAYLSFQKHFR